MNDFFKSLEARLKAQDATAQRESLGRPAEEEKVRHFVSAVVPILREYKGKLEELGISVRLIAHEFFFEFVMVHLDREVAGFELTTDRHSGRYTINGVFSENGKQYRSLDHGPTDWNVESFTQYLEREINSFVESAPRHRGYRR